MSGYLWASGYQYTNHILYQPPKLPQLLQKAYEFAVLAKDPDVVLRIVDMMDGTSIWAKGFSSHSSDAALNQTSPMSKSAQLILVLKMLDDSANHGGGKFQIVSNQIRNEIVSYALEADPIEIKKVVEAWLSILAKVPADPEGFPEDSGSTRLNSGAALNSRQRLRPKATSPGSSLRLDLRKSVCEVFTIRLVSLTVAFTRTPSLL